MLLSSRRCMAPHLAHLRQLRFASGCKIGAYVSAQGRWHYRGASSWGIRLGLDEVVLGHAYDGAQRDARSL